MSKIKVEFDVDILNTKQKLKEFKTKYGLREDWHEPDEQNITASVVGHYFDNANIDGSTDYALLFFYEGKPVAVVNLANLCAWSTGGNTNV
jgi:hypothetical protein